MGRVYLNASNCLWIYSYSKRRMYIYTLVVTIDLGALDLEYTAQHIFIFFIENTLGFSDKFSIED